MTDQALKTTPLTSAHRAAGARMVPFGGYEMPVQYADGVLKEHLWTRARCGLFDVSHMGPAFLQLRNRSRDPKADHAAVAALIEPLICGDIRGLKRGQLRYTLLLNSEGGVASSPMDVLSRLETLVLMAGYEIPLVAIRQQISRAVNLIIQMRRTVEGARQVVAITEVTGFEEGHVTLQDIFVLARNRATGQTGFYPTGYNPPFLQTASNSGITVPPNLFTVAA